MTRANDKRKRTLKRELQRVAMRTGLVVLVAFVAILFPRNVPAAPPESLAPFLRQHCYDCHDAATKEGGLDLTALGGDFSDLAIFAKWERIHDRVRDGEMPPPDVDEPPTATRDGFLKTLAADLTTAHAAKKGTVLRRLNRYEYERTLNGLLGVRVQVAEMLPEDGKSHGFDNIGEALDLSPVQMQRYLQAAQVALDAAVQFGPKPEPRFEELRFDTGRNQQFVGEHWHRRDDGAVVFYLEGGYPGIKVQEFRVRAPGVYRIRLHVAAHQSDRPIAYAVHFGRDSLEEPAALHSYREALPGAVRVDELTTELKKDDTLRLFVHGLDPSVNHWVAVNRKADQFAGPGLAVLKVEVEGPVIDQWPGRGHCLRFGDLEAADTGPEHQRKASWYRPVWRLVSEDPESDVERVLLPFIEAAFRRPVDAEAAAPFIALARQELASGATIDDALRTAQTAVLCSPDFLYLLEGPGRLDDYALAARLSYALWGLPPDEQLLTLAARGQLFQPAQRRAQTERLLNDPRAAWFTETFVGQWLNLREIDFTVPDRQLYPEYDEPLKSAMLDETRRFFGEVLAKNLSVSSFLDSDWTFLNERLARHYGIEGVRGVAMRRAVLKPEDRRGGVLTHASVLKVSANGTTTSPVVRGAYVLERIMGIQPPPPPPGVPGVEPDIRGAATLREQLDKHRSISSCNSCHRIIDPPGFALENYDVMGGWREHYRSLGTQFPSPPREATGGRGVPWRIGPPVDASGETPDGQRFDGLADYKQILLSEPKRFTRTLAEKLATYATGRGMGFSDRAELQRIADAVADRGYGFRDLVHEVVQSEIFGTK